MSTLRAHAPLHFATWNPHFTPQWLSETLAGQLPESFRGLIVDPACGAGNLLAAVALNTGPAGADRTFLGYDTSTRAVKSCVSALGAILAPTHFNIERRDFLALTTFEGDRRVAVLMNPPFRGYGSMTERRRTQVRRRVGMRGRFNLAYAFVLKAIRVFEPDLLVALLPSNWVYSGGSSFRGELDALGGTWTWRDVGDAFPGVSAHVGVLNWTSAATARTKGLVVPKRLLRAVGSLSVHQGIATGRDGVFEDLASLALPVGTIREAMRGRDVARGTSSLIWVPPTRLTRRSEEMLSALVPRPLRETLEARSCVRAKKRQAFEFQESMPEWFTGEPKVLVPEVVSRQLRADLDADGSSLPLHSVIAIRVPSAALGQELVDHLQDGAVERDLKSSSPRLSGGAWRLQVGAIRRCVDRWITSRVMR